ncbi:Hypp6740 [Branchiostoma lanceolatum]|uniref:Hypp6740 protein n=1 Tax=Branchiostoma lanceolatum TaxID=7740 RepID=A0A8J9YVG8_BRALA|nr:Hypp6740 [Branchiostoma lanceolatum]
MPDVMWHVYASEARRRRYPGARPAYQDTESAMALHVLAKFNRLEQEPDESYRWTLVTDLGPFNVFRKDAVWHIPHEFSAEMEQPSKQILHKIQEDFIPAEVDEDGCTTKLVHPILPGGDWLSEERAENIQAAFKNLDTPEERLDGMVPKHEGKKTGEAAAATKGRRIAQGAARKYESGSPSGTDTDSSVNL